MKRRGALSVPNFRMYFFSAGVSQCGSWLLRTTQAWLVLDLTGSAAALGIVITVQALPVTLFTLLSGVVIDRTQTLRMLLAVQVLFCVQAAVLAALILTDQVQFSHVLVLAAVLGIASAVDFPARSAIVSELVEPGQVGNGIAMNSALNSAARIIGPGIGGLMLAIWGSGVCFAVTAVVYVAATAGLFLIKSDQLYPKRLASRAPLFRQLGEGLKYSFSTPSLAVNMVLAGFYGTFAYNWALVLPLYARFALESGPEGFGALNVAMGIGSTVGAFALATRVQTTVRLLLISAGTFAASILVLSAMPTLALAVGMLILTGVLSTLFNATNNTLLQVEAREELRGRVLSLYMFLMIGTTPVGGALTGAVASALDIRVALQINATVCLVGLVCAAVLLWRSRSQTAALEPR